MTDRKTYDLDQIKVNLFSKKQDVRLKTVEDVMALSKTRAKPLLKQAIVHWDRRLRATAAKAMVNKFQAQAAPWIIASAKKKDISINLTVRLLSQCDSNTSAKYLREIIRYGNQINSEEAVNSIAHLTCEEATFFQWEKSDRFTPKIKNRLDKIADKKVESFIRRLPDWKFEQLINTRSARSYFKKRGLNKVYERAKEPPVGKSVALQEKPITKKENFLELVARKTKLNISQHLGWIVRYWNNLEKEYSEFDISKKTGGIRKLSAPSARLKFVQKAINEKILAKQPLHRSCHGFTRKKSIVTNAKPHTGKEVLINIDLKDFFPSISAGRVYGIFLSLGFEVEVARFLTRITTYKSCLPQGAPTSPALANLTCRRLDSRLAGLSKKLKARYTLYADDLTFSGKENIITGIPLIRQIIKDEGFVVAQKKVELSGRATGRKFWSNRE